MKQIKTPSLKNKLINEFIYNNCTKEEFDEYIKYESTSYVDDIKNIIINKLDDIDSSIILLYAEFGNMRDVANKLDVSLGTIYKRIKKIQNKIIDEYNKNYHI